ATVVLVSTEEIPGAVPVDAATASSLLAAAIDAARPRGKGKPMTSVFGDWRVRKEKKQKRYDDLGPMPLSKQQFKERCANVGLDVQTISTRPGGKVVCKMRVMVPDDFSEQEREQLYKALSPAWHSPAGESLARDILPLDLARFDELFDPHLALTG